MFIHNNSISSLLGLQHYTVHSNNPLAEKYVSVHAHTHHRHKISEPEQKTYRFLVTQ